MLLHNRRLAALEKVSMGLPPAIHYLDLQIAARSPGPPDASPGQPSGSQVRQISKMHAIF